MCSIGLTFVDVDTGETVLPGVSDLSTNITITTQELTENRRYNVTILASTSQERISNKSSSYVLCVAILISY